MTPDASLADGRPLDVLHVPGGLGQEALMEDTEVLDSIPAAGDRRVPHFLRVHRRLAVWRGRPPEGTPATTHWASLLRLFGDIPVDERVVVDGAWVFAAASRPNLRALRLAAGVARRGRRSGHSASHGLCAGAALRQRHARDRASRDTRAGAAIHAGDHSSARADGESRRRPPRHCCSGGWRKPRVIGGSANERRTK